MFGRWGAGTDSYVYIGVEMLREYRITLIPVYVGKDKRP